MECQFIQARDLEDAYFQCLYRLVDYGRKFKVNRGSYAGQYRLELDWVTIQIKSPSTGPLLPVIPPQYGFPNPVSEEYLDQYLPYLLSSEVQPGESYTYGQRLNKAFLNFKLSLPPKIFKEQYPHLIEEVPELVKENIISYNPEEKVWSVNQVELVIWTYKKKGFRNNQMVLQVAQPEDLLLKDPPCLRHIDTRIQDNKLNFFPYFRSWDAYSGLPSNLAAIQTLKEYMACSVGVNDGEIIASSKGLHVYDFVFEIVECLRNK